MEDEVGDRGAPQGRQGLGTGGLLVLEEERLQGYLTIFTIMTNVVRELVGELNLRSVEAFLRFVERYLGGPPGLMKIFKLR
jgi:hypothetical protein